VFLYEKETDKIEIPYDVRVGTKFCSCDAKQRKESRSVTAHLGTYSIDCKDFNLGRCRDEGPKRGASKGVLIQFSGLEQLPRCVSTHRNSFGFSSVVGEELSGLQGKSIERSVS
jgi:hypothetical protein